MAARTGAEFLRGLKDSRELWLGDERIDDPATHPALAGAAHAIAAVFDLQHAAAEICLMADPETGEPINVSHMIPRSRADLERRHACLERTAEFSMGLMGRTPDYMNVTYAGFAGRHDEWSANGNEEGAENLVRYQKHMARADLSLTHAIVHSTVDRTRGPPPVGFDAVQLHKVEDTAHGILVRGSRVLATLAPFADEIAVYPGRPDAGRRPAPCAVLLHPDGDAGAEIPLPRQRLRARQSHRSSVLQPVRRTGRVRHLRRRRGAARARVHRRRRAAPQRGDPPLAGGPTSCSTPWCGPR